ncbi:MAG: hypothetical protein ABSD42_00590 [Candidatus Bathyarchaeia archaeon]|jgi:hypothetical protein
MSPQINKYEIFPYCNRFNSKNKVGDVLVASVYAESADDLKKPASQPKRVVLNSQHLYFRFIKTINQ